MDRIRERGTAWARYLLPVIAVVMIAVTVIIIIAVIPSTKRLIHAEPDRIECPGLTEDNCTQKMCVFDKVTYGPSCYMKKDSFGYVVKEIKEEADGPLILLKSIANHTPYGPSIQNVLFKLTYLTENIVRFQLKDAEKQRYEVPVQKDFPLLQDPLDVDHDHLSYTINYTHVSEVFQFSIKRTNGSVLWDTSIGALLLSDQYLQIASYLPSQNIYGLGEHVHDTLRHKMDFVSWPMFARDRFPPSTADQSNLYGVHPFYTCLEKSGLSHGVLFLNSNAMEATLLPAPAISFRTIGGILDFFIFVGDNPEHVIQLYTSLIGRPMIPPYWSLGFQLCKYGYNELSTVQEVLNRTRNARIPQAVQYLDIDHMDERKDFTYDSKTFPGLPQFMTSQRDEYRLKWIIILDPTIAADDEYTTYTSGLKKSVYVKRAKFWENQMFPDNLQNINVTFGKVWPPYFAAFPDFFLDQTRDWWKQNIAEYRKTINFDGLWIDMNEPANFETNFENPSYCKETEFKNKDCRALVCPKSRYDDPPYNPLLELTGDRLSEKTLCMESVQSEKDVEYRHYDVHNLYGWSQSQPTLEAAQEATGTRSLVISRSTYPSSGRYAGHWLGDNTSNFLNMKNSIIGMLEFNMFGIPYIGADICGFFGKPNAQLCKRWMQVGAFYPFFRNHNSMDDEPQDPAFFGEEVATASRKAAERRITLNPYLYTLFYKAHVDGSTVVRPLFHEFPTDELTWDLGKQFMWGRSLLITPILEENQTSVYKYLPKGEWWNFNYETTRLEENTGRYVTDSNADEYTPLHVRGGTILPVAVYDWNKYPEEDYATTREMNLYVFPENGISLGELFMDDGLSIDTVKNNAYAVYTFHSAQCKLQIKKEEHEYFKGPKPFLEKIFIFKVKSVTKVSGNYPVTMNEELHMATVTVKIEMSKLEELTWEDSEGKCAMMD